MIRQSGKRLFDKFQLLKNKLKKTNFYYFIRDNIFFHEMKIEKRVEKKGDFEIEKYIRKWYKSSTGFDLNLNNPKTLTEKQQWIKLYDRQEIKSVCSDKIAVRNYIKNKIGDQYLIPLIKNNNKYFFDNAEEIDFDTLPSKFVIACNHGSSMTIVINNKNDLKKKEIRIIKKKLNRWLKIDPTYISAFDYVYSGIKPQIMITENLANSKSGLSDYKILCFNGKPKYFWIDSDRFTSHKRKVYNLDRTPANFNINKYEDSNEPLPPEFNDLVSLAEILCKDFIFVRVDFYVSNSKIYFGELTFNSGAGAELPYPIEYNKILGDQLNLKN